MTGVVNIIVYLVAMAVIFGVYQLILLSTRVYKTWRLSRDRQERDRQGNVFTVHDEASRDSRYNDIFYIEPNSAEAARIRAQLEKDDKDLPSYDEVVRMTNLTQPTAAPASVTTMTASNASVNTTDTILSVPPYSEVDPYASTSSNATATTEGAATLHITSPPPALPTSLTNVNGHHSAAAAVVALPITTHTSSNV